MGNRDRRADVLEDDPFSKQRSAPRIHRIHQRVDREGTVHIDSSSPFSGALMQFLGRENWEQPKHHTGRIWHFSDVEKQHLRLAMAAFTLALGLMAAGGIFTLANPKITLSAWLVNLLLAMPVMFIAVGPAFLFHEIGHKLVAKKNGCWAEFRADPKGLQFGVAIAFFAGFLFMAPGAVMVAGLVTRRQNGHIAVAGPLTNFGLFVVGIPLWGLILGLSGAHEHLAANASEVFDRVYLVNGALVWQAMLADAAYFWIAANLFLGLFNMLPFGPLDGLKVKDWNEQAFFAVLSLFAILVVPMILGMWSPQNVLSFVAEPISSLLR